MIRAVLTMLLLSVSTASLMISTPRFLVAMRATPLRGSHSSRVQFSPIPVCRAILGMSSTSSLKLPQLLDQYEVSSCENMPCAALQSLMTFVNRENWTRVKIYRTAHRGRNLVKYFCFHAKFRHFTKTDQHLKFLTADEA